MGTLERTLKCPNCLWEGRRIIETLKPRDDGFWEKFAFVVGNGLKSVKCPHCGTSTTPSTKELVS